MSVVEHPHVVEMKLPRVSVGGTSMCQIIIGTWQVSAGFGDASVDGVVAAMIDCYNAGYSTFDLSPAFGGAEEIFGVLAQRLERECGECVHEQLHGLTKWNVFEWPHLHIGKHKVVGVCERARQKLKVPRLSAIQLFWGAPQTRNEPAMVQALQHMVHLKETAMLREVSVCSFNEKQLQEAVQNDITISSNQVEWSLVDQRPSLGNVAQFCAQNGIHILAHGTLCGGLISERYLGKPEPKPSSPALGKHLQMIGLWGGWSLFQQLLRVLKECAIRHGVSISNVATRAVLQQSAVSVVVIGHRLGASNHLMENKRIFEFELNERDLQAIAAVTDQARDLLLILGDCGDECRSGGT